LSVQENLAATRAIALSRHHWKRLADLTLIAGAAGLLLLIAWSCGRGLDLLDESHYLLDALHPDDSVVGASASQRFLSPLFAAVDHNISVYRFAGLALLVSSAIVLAYRTRHLADDWTGRGLSLSLQGLVATSLLGSLLYYFWFIRSPSYNLLIVVGAYLFTGLFLWILEARLGTASFRIRATGLGIVWGFCLLVKFPSGVALLGLAGVAFLFWHGWSWRHAGSFAACFAAGAVISLALYFILVEAPDAAMARVQGAIELLNSPGFNSESGLSSNIIRYFTQSSLGIHKALHHFWPAFVCVALGFAASFVVRDRTKALLCVTIGFLVAFALFNGLAVRIGFYGWQFTPKDLDLFYYYFVATVLVLTAVGGAAIATRRFESSAIERIGGKRLSILLAFLFAVPLAAGFGTGNPITVNALLAMGPWFIATAILAAVLSLQCQRSWIAPTVMLTLGTMACADVVSGAMHPYGIYATVFEQTERTELGPGGHSLKLDPPTSSYVKELRDLASRAGITAQSDVIFFYDSPGSVLALGAHSPGVPWFFSAAPNASIVALAGVSRERLQRAYLLVDLQLPPLPPLSRLGLNFPADYELVGEVLRRPIQHHIQLWRPRAP
jgi:hypothetical protein